MTNFDIFLDKKERKLVEEVRPYTMLSPERIIAFRDAIIYANKYQIKGAGSGWIAMPIENRGEGNILHPVFAKKGSARYADKASWSNKNSHPAFMAPALEAHREEVLQIIEDVVYAEILKSLKV